MQDDNQDISNVPSRGPDFKTELAKRLNELAPEAVADGKVDIGKLKELLDGDVSDTTERFGLFWPGKKRAMRAAQESTTATLRPAPDESKDWSTTKNIFIEGDNLEVLKVMQKQYHNKIKMIYTDPPYNTGKDFVYPDNFKEGLQNYLEFSKQVDEGGKRVSTNSDTEGRYHSNWLNMMYPRLKLARNLLTDDGLIFISIDDHEQDNLKKVCNEIFGEENFIDCLIWKKRYGGGAKEKYFISLHEYILVYSRNANRLDEITIPLSDDMIKRYYTLRDENFEKRGPFRTHPLEATKSMGDRPNLIFPIKAPDGTDILPHRQWLWSKETVEEALQYGELYFTRNGKWAVHTKQYLRDRSGNIRVGKFQSVIDDVFTQHGTNEIIDLFGNAQIFPFPKPSSLIKRLISSGTTKDSIILDFFCGSGTTAQAVMQMNAEDGGNRQHIQVQLPEPVDEKSEAYKAGYKTIAQIARARINRAGEKIKIDLADKLAERQEPLDTGYRTFKLADTNFTKWQSDHTGDVNEFQQRLLDMRESANDDASEIDILTEVLLKLGLELTVDAVQKDIAGLNMWSISNGNILAYIKERQKPTLDQLRAAADTHPVKIVVLDDAFKGDDELKTNLTQICKTNHVELWTV